MVAARGVLESGSGPARAVRPAAPGLATRHKVAAAVGVPVPSPRVGGAFSVAVGRG